MFDLKKVYEITKTVSKRQLGTDPEEYIALKRIPNPEYRAELAREYRAVANVIKSLSDDAQNELSDTILARVIANTVVVGWGKKFCDGGKAIPFSIEACEEIMKKYPEFRADCVAYAEDRANYKGAPDASLEGIKKP